jgi:hypothetical protein
MPDERTEFGYPRTNCACKVCKNNCRHMPGFLIPSDLERMIPHGVNPMQWAEDSLLASPGAIVVRNRELVRVPLWFLLPKRMVPAFTFSRSNARSMSCHRSAVPSSTAIRNEATYPSKVLSK